MKRLAALLTALVLCFFCSFALGEEDGVITIRQWLDCRGETGGMMVVCVLEIINPVLARVADDTGEVNLFGVTVDGEFKPLTDMDIVAGDVLVLKNPRYNEFEGTIEMADAVLAEKITSLRYYKNLYDTLYPVYMEQMGLQ